MVHNRSSSVHNLDQGITELLQTSEILPFADDTNISSLGLKKSKNECNLSAISSRLVANKLSLNLEKTVQLY